MGKLESTLFTPWTTVHIHGEQMQREQIAYGETEAENGNTTVVTPQISGKPQQRS